MGAWAYGSGGIGCVGTSALPIKIVGIIFLRENDAIYINEKFRMDLIGLRSALIVDYRYIESDKLLCTVRVGFRNDISKLFSQPDLSLNVSLWEFKTWEIKYMHFIEEEIFKLWNFNSFASVNEISRDVI